jgi:hypothetical protein
MPASEAYRPLANRCAELAIACSAPSVAAALLALALDYMALGDKIRSVGSSVAGHRTGESGRGVIAQQDSAYALYPWQVESVRSAAFGRPHRYGMTAGVRSCSALRLSDAPGGLPEAVALTE